MRCWHLHGDADGRDAPHALSSCPFRESYAGTVRSLTDIPVTTMGMGQFIGRKPDVGVHNAPRRQFLVVLKESSRS